MERKQKNDFKFPEAQTSPRATATTLECGGMDALARSPLADEQFYAGLSVSAILFCKPHPIQGRWFGIFSISHILNAAQLPRTMLIGW